MSPAARTASARKAVEQQREAAGQAQQPHETRAKARAAKAAAKAATKAALEKRNRGRRSLGVRRPGNQQVSQALCASRTGQAKEEDR